MLAQDRHSIKTPKDTERPLKETLRQIEETRAKHEESREEKQMSAQRHGFTEDWYVLAAAGKAEPNHGENMGPSNAGAMWPMKFFALDLTAIRCWRPRS